MVTDRTPCLGVGVPGHVKVHYQFHTMLKQTHQEIIFLKEIFQNVHLRFLDAIDYLWNHPASIDDTETTAPKNPTGQGHSKRSVLSGLGEIVMSIFRGGNSIGYNHATIDKIKKKLTKTYRQTTLGWVCINEFHQSWIRRS